MPRVLSGALCNDSGVPVQPHSCTEPYCFDRDFLGDAKRILSDYIRDSFEICGAGNYRAQEAREQLLETQELETKAVTEAENPGH